MADHDLSRPARWPIKALVLVLASACAPPSGRVEPGPDAPLTVRSAGVAVDISARGEIRALRFADGRRWEIGGDITLSNTAATQDDECKAERPARRVRGGAVEIIVLCFSDSGEATRVTQLFSPGQGAIDWTLEVEALASTYARGIWTRLLGWNDSQHRRFWTSWGEAPKPRNENPTWTDPLEPQRFEAMSLAYGGNAITRQNGFSLPIASVIEVDTDHGLSLVQSPRDALLDLELRTSPNGDISLGRFHNRLEPGRPVTFHVHLVPHAGDWRPGVGWLARRYREFFAPSSPHTDDVAGLSAYSSQRDALDPQTAARLNAIGFGVNWDATFDWPYLGMFLPTASENEEWVPYGTGWRERTGDAQANDPERVRVQSLRDVASAWRARGFHQLGYFNTTEFGTAITHPRPAQEYACDAADLWKNPNDYLYCNLEDALLRGPDSVPIFTWEGAVVMDPGEPVYRDYLLNQARRLLDLVPEYAGINIDRLDWITQYNRWRDDGVSWFDDAPARSLVSSWKELLPDLAKLVHDRGKVLYVSPTTASRLDWMRHVDGFLGEYVSADLGMNLTAFLGLEKPVMGWTWPDWRRDGSSEVDPDRYLQSHLHMGVLPMAPVDRNDHGIRPSRRVDDVYLAYGPMFRALRNRRWVLEPHIVTIDGGHAIANLFEVEDGIAIPVTFGGDADTITLRVKRSFGAQGIDWERAWHTVPGWQGAWRLLPARHAGDVTVVAVPLERGSALVRFSRPGER